MVLQGANWQRGGGKGDKPKRIERPKEPSNLSGIKSAEQLADRKNRLAQEKKRREQK